MDKPLFTVSNQHDESCGQPQGWDGDEPGVITSYFQNQHGDQWMLQYRDDTKRATIWGSDCGWDKPRILEDGRLLPDTILTTAELAWVLACWLIVEERRRFRQS